MEQKSTNLFLKKMQNDSKVQLSSKKIGLMGEEGKGSTTSGTSALCPVVVQAQRWRSRFPGG